VGELVICNVRHAAAAVTVTLFPAEIVTLSPDAGTIPPGHGALLTTEFQLPLPVLAMFAADVMVTPEITRNRRVRGKNTVAIFFMVFPWMERNRSKLVERFIK
jgi:hypothetical protein